MKRLQQLIRRVGLIGVAGVVILLLCAVFYLSAVKPAEGEIAAQRVAALHLKSRSPYKPIAVDKRSDDLRRFQNLFPTTGKIPIELEKLWVTASVYQIDLLQGEYRLESGGLGLARYHITLPVRATYAQLRSFVNIVLKELPTASIDGLRFERKSIDETQLDAQIDLSLYFRSAGTAVAQP
jgi:hypothetical protein